MRLLELFLELFLVGLTGVDGKSLKGPRLGLLVFSLVASCALIYYLVVYLPGI